MLKHPAIIEVNLKTRIGQMIIGTTHYPNTPTKNILTFNKLLSTIPSKINQNGVQGINPEGLQFNVDNTFLLELQIENDLLQNITNKEILNLKKADLEEDFFNKILIEGRGFINIDYLKNLAVPSHANLLASFNALYMQIYEKNMGIFQKKTNKELLSINAIAKIATYTKEDIEKNKLKKVIIDAEAIITLELNNKNNSPNIIKLFQKAKTFNELQKPSYSCRALTIYTVSEPDDP